MLGVFEAIQCGQIERTVSPGDRIYLYTDGLIERFGQAARGRGQGSAALTAACLDAARLPLDAAVDAIANATLEGAGRPEDDVVLMGIEV